MAGSVRRAAHRPISPALKDALHWTRNLGDPGFATPAVMEMFGPHHRSQNVRQRHFREFLASAAKSAPSTVAAPFDCARLQFDCTAANSYGAVTVRGQ
ncbi:MAG: hypothetical protein LAQ69_41115 [Acidobacteriia bacterium]|nr:hypothetical protein [Terriglobia bacterium]